LKSGQSFMDLKPDQDTHNHDVVAEAIAAKEKAESLRGVAIQQLLKQQEQIQANLKALGYTSVNGNGTKHAPTAAGEERAAANDQPKKRFKDLKLGQIAKILLTEHETLHGTKIEQLAKTGGYMGGKTKFQAYLPVALKREGIFENIGKNTWRLKTRSA
jgi:hypothetical protein